MHPYDIRPLTDFLLGGAHSGPAKQDRITKDERAFPLHPAHPKRDGTFDQGAASAGTGAAPTFGDDE